ncbi:unnamed protein product [Didymodactylos carnosus]|uniref:Cerebral cavernous malformations 2 harmonin-homology domain-containing protein n=2 Tax=Didymodactylos carnosus TaxID=1234261 RepID=A0A815CAU9_9BILA|nr:unnamed protein product [Didymodactylos carnosus]CAF4083855.1 unnamed protein product [Didymodactylos carnosus]
MFTFTSVSSPFLNHLSRTPSRHSRIHRPPSPWSNNLADNGKATFFVQYAGTIELSQADDKDLSYKKKLLMLIYRHQLENNLSTNLTERSTVQLHITTEIMTFMDSDQNTILSLAPQNTIMCYYVEYRLNHIMAMKFIRTTEKIELAVFLMFDRRDADDLCSSMDYCFRSIYIANEYSSNIANKLSLLKLPLSATQSNTATSISSIKNNNTQNVPNKETTIWHSDPNLSVETSTIVTTESSTSSEINIPAHRHHRRDRNSKKSTKSAESSTKGIKSYLHIIRNYLVHLQKELNQEELTKFGDLLSRWQAEKITFRSFVEQTSNLYGESRLYLLNEMEHFAPVEEQIWFEEFLKDLNVNTTTSSTETLLLEEQSGNSNTQI